MHDYMLLRESLVNISRWKNRRVLVCFDMDFFVKEKYSLALISDTSLLVSVGVDITFACVGSQVPAFVEKAKAREINTVVLQKYSDVVGLAESIRAPKVFFLNEGDGIYDHDHLLVREITSVEAGNLINKSIVRGSLSEKLRLAIQLCDGYVERVHFINGLKEGAFIDEFLSNKGSGTMIYYSKMPYKKLRKAVARDIDSVVNIIRNSVDSSIVEDVVLRHIENNYIVFTVDGCIHAVALFIYNKSVIEIGYLAHTNEFDASEALRLLIEYIINNASSDVLKVTIDPSKSPSLIGIWPWFLNLGFSKQEIKKGQKKWVKEIK